MLTREKRAEDFSVSPSNTLEIMLDGNPGWTMGIAGESSEINHQEFGRYLVEEDGFTGFIVFDSSEVFSSVLLAFIEVPSSDIEVSVPYPNFGTTLDDDLTIKTEVYEKQGIKLIVNLKGSHLRKFRTKQVNPQD